MGEVEEVTIDTVNRLRGYERDKVLSVRADWLDRSRKQDKISLKTLERKKEETRRLNLGLCFYCGKPNDRKFIYCSNCSRAASVRLAKRMSNPRYRARYNKKRREYEYLRKRREKGV